jgi:hypothetical protein
LSGIGVSMVGAAWMCELLLSGDITEKHQPAGPTIGGCCGYFLSTVFHFPFKKHQSRQAILDHFYQRSFPIRTAKAPFWRCAAGVS